MNSPQDVCRFLLTLLVVTQRQDEPFEQRSDGAALLLHTLNRFCYCHLHQGEATHTHTEVFVSHLGHEEAAAVVEHLGVVGTLSQSEQPHADRLVCVPLQDVELGQSVSQRARVGTEVQQRLTQRDAFIEPAGSLNILQGNN